MATRVTELALVKRILSADPAWAAYALADLQPGFAEECVWFVGETGVRDAGLVMFYAGLTPPILFAMGPADAVGAALEQAAGAGELPNAAYLSILAQHEAAVGRWYDLSAAWKDRRPMLRMVLAGAASFVAAASAVVFEDATQSRLTAAEAAATMEAAYSGKMQLRRLTAIDAPRLEALFAQGGDFAPDAFDAAQIDNGVFYGVAGHGGELLAAGGTHIVDWQAGVAAVGNFYTLPIARGKGYAGALLGAIVHDLRAGGVTNIVLNVDQRNTAAQRLYKRHGFVEHCKFLEGCVNSKIGDR